MKSMRMALLGLGLGLMVAGEAGAQTTVAGSAQLTVGQVLALDVTSTTINFGTVSAADYGDTDFTGAGGPYYRTTGTQSSVSTLGNVPHDVTVEADQAFFGSSSGNNENLKAASDLEWSTDGGTNWNTFDVAPTNVITNQARGRNSGIATVDYRVRLDLATDSPDGTNNETYTLPFTYTIVAN
mgnify:CR=1 FL=1